MFIDIFVSTNDVLLTHHYATDFSAGPEGDEKSFPKNVVGSVTELLESVKSGKKILNSLEFPMLDPPSSTLHIPLTWQHGVPPAAFHLSPQVRIPKRQHAVGFGRIYKHIYLHAH